MPLLSEFLPPSVGSGERSTPRILQPALERIDQAEARQRRKLNPDEELRRALAACLEAEKLIPAEQERLRAEAALLEPGVARDYKLFQADLVEKQLRRAAVASRARIALLDRLTTPEAQADERALCERDVVHFVRNWAWTLDPRSDSPLAVVPFDPFDFQEDALRWLDALVYTGRADGVLEKSRDMGATWTAVYWSLAGWLSRPYTQILFGSYNILELDSSEQPDTLFEKLRFARRLLPSFLQPEGYSAGKHEPLCRLVNPANGSVISGAPATPNFGRGGRYTAIFLDEHAAWPYRGKPQWTACSQSSRSKISISTPRGMQTKQYELRQTPGIALLSLLWKKHPWKDTRWYLGQAATMQPHEVAQEIDGDYKASETGEIFREWDETRHLITWEEFADEFGPIARDEKGLPRIPPIGALGFAVDVGETLGHPTCAGWIWRPPEQLPHADCLFVYRSLCRPEWPLAPEGWKPPTPKRIAAEVYRLEQPWRERHRGDRDGFEMRLMSHEATDWYNVFNRVSDGSVADEDKIPAEHMLAISKWTPGRRTGIAQAQGAMEIDWTRLNPFRRYPVGAPEHLRDLEGKQLEGRTGIYFICETAQGALFWDRNGELKARPGLDDAGHARPRAEIPAYRRPQDVAGDEKLDVKKTFDDAVDWFRGLLSRFGPTVVPMQAEEKARRKVEEMRPDLVVEAIRRRKPEDQTMLLINRLDQIAKETDALQSAGFHEYNPFGAEPDPDTREEEY